MKVSVLNLKHRADRYNRIVKALTNEGVDYDIDEAVYWKDTRFLDILKDRDMKIYNKWITPWSKNRWYNRKVNAGEAAVAMSTILMWERLLRDYPNENLFLCLQDDCEWKQGEMKVILDLIETTLTKGKFDGHLPHGADLLYLCGYHVSGYDYQFKSIDKWYEEPDYVYNAHAIVYSRHAIERMLAFPYKNHLMSLDEYLMIQCKTTGRLDVSRDLGIERPMKAIKLKHAENIFQQINDKDEIISDINGTPEV